MVMPNFLNIFVNLSLLFINYLLEIKYYIKRYIFNRTHKSDIEINSIYVIDELEKKIKLIDNIFVDKLNHLISYSNYIPLKNILLEEDLNIGEGLLEIRYRKNGRNYIVNFPLNKDNILFPTYSSSEIKNRNMNLIVDINDDNNLLDLFCRYSGPLNDFYISKDLGIKLKNIYDLDNGKFPFREGNYKLEDIFLNEYRIGEGEEIRPEDIFRLKNTLDNSKIDVNNNDEMILNKYKKMQFDGKTMIIDFIYSLFGKQKAI